MILTLPTITIYVERFGILSLNFLRQQVKIYDQTKNPNKFDMLLGRFADLIEADLIKSKTNLSLR